MSTRLPFIVGTALCLMPMAMYADTAQSLRAAATANRPTLTRSTLTQKSTSVVYSPQAPQRVPDDGREYTTVLEEDFSLCSAGSTDDPDKTFIENADYTIPSKYTHTPGWSGRAVMQAGGAICIGMTKDPYTGKVMTGQIETPQLDLHRDQGRAYLSFRAKALPADMDMLTVRWVTPGDPLPVTGEEQMFYVTGTTWQTINVSLTDCPEDAIIQIYSENAEVLIDDIKIEQYHAEIDAPKALKWTDFTGDSFTANWTAVEGADHYILNVFWIRREGSEEQLPDYKYVVKNLDVKENHYHVTGLNPEKVYYYYVRAVSATGALSEESQVVEVMALTVPAGITVSDVTAAGFRASWEPVRNAEGYGFQAILTHTAQADEDYALLDEKFDAIQNEGSIGDPYVNTIGYYDMDSYGMTRANWVMYEGGVINGALCLHNYVSSYGEQYYGELVSPIMTIGKSTGEIALEADFATLDKGVRPYIQIAVPGTVDGTTTWVLGDGGEIRQEIGETWTHIKQTYKVKPGLVRFSIGTTDGGWLYLDNLRLSVKLPAGATQTLPYKYDEVKEELDAPTYYCATPDRSTGDAYSFAVMAARLKPGSYLFPIYINSDWSDTIHVPAIAEDGVTDAIIAAGQVSATATTDGIAVLNPDGRVVTVHDLTGRIIASTTAESPTLPCSKGVYIVGADGHAVAKIIVK